MATNTSMTFLMKKSGNDYTKLVDIKDYPDLKEAPDLLPTTTLSNKSHTNILGIQNQGALTFTHNYDETDYAALAASATTDETAPGDYAIWFGGTVSGSTVTPTGSDGKFEFKGVMAEPTILGKGVNEVREMQSTIAVCSEITKASA